MSGPLFLGVDIGTTNTKSAVFDAAGTLLGSASRPVPLRSSPDGRVEQDTEEYCLAVADTARRALQAADGLAASVVAVGLTGQMGGMIGLDRTGTPLFPCDTVSDTRADGIREAALARWGDLIVERNATLPYTAPKMRWWREHRPEIYRRIRTVVMPHHFVGMWLTGLDAEGAFIDRTCVGLTGLADVRSSSWSAELCDLWNVDGTLLPRIVDPRHVCGKLHADRARDLGLAAGIPIIAGAGDAVSGWLGGGAVDPGTVVDTAGTSNHFSLVTTTLRPDSQERVLSHFPSVFPDRWHLLGYNAGAGLVHQWFVSEFGRPARDADESEMYAVLDCEAHEIAPGSDGLLFFPYLGGRSCPPQPEMQGAWIGFTWSHRRAHFYRSLLESIAYDYAFFLREARRLHPEIHPVEVRLIGGGTRSAVWTEIRAHVLGLDYVRFPGGHESCRGAALLAAHAVSAVDDLESAARRLASPTDRVSSDPAVHERYGPAVQRYIEAVEAMRPVFRTIRRTAMPAEGVSGS